MRIDAVDFFSLSMPEIVDRGDGSQDALLVRVRSENLVGWGECEAAPLVSIASRECPRLSQRAQAAARLGAREARGEPRRHRLHRARGAAPQLRPPPGPSRAVGHRHRPLGPPRDEGRRAGPAPPRLQGSAAEGPLRLGPLRRGPRRDAREGAAHPRGGLHGREVRLGPYGAGDVATDAEHVRAARRGADSAWRRRASSMPARSGATTWRPPRRGSRPSRSAARFGSRRPSQPARSTPTPRSAGACAASATGPQAMLSQASMSCVPGR